jgi:hypothetical protein
MGGERWKGKGTWKVIGRGESLGVQPLQTNNGSRGLWPSPWALDCVVKVWCFHRDFLFFWKKIAFIYFSLFFCLLIFFFPVFLLVFFNTIFLAFQKFLILFWFFSLFFPFLYFIFSNFQNSGFIYF